MNNSTCLSTTSPGNSAWSFGTRYKKRQQLSYRSMWSSSESWEFFWGKVEGCGGLQESRHLQVCFFTVKPMLTILVWQWALISVMNSQTEEHWIISWILPKISVIYTGSLISTPWKPTFAKTGPWFSWMSLAGPFAWSPVGKPTVWILCAYIFNTMDQYRSDEPDLNTGFLDRMLV